MHEWWLVALASLAAYRVTRLVTSDKITEPFFEKIRYTFEARWVRRQLRKGTLTDAEAESAEWNSKLAYLLSCPWCLGFWVSGVTTVLVSMAYGLDYPILTWLAMSTVIGFLGRIDGE
jgi:uncharacterized protein DUF1360